MGGVVANLQDVLSEEFEYNSESSIQSLSIPIKIEARKFYNIKIAGTMRSDSAGGGEALNVYLTPSIGLQGTQRINFFGMINSAVNFVTNDNYNDGLMIARATRGNGFLYTGEIYYSGSVLQSLSCGGVVNGSNTLNLQIRTILAGFTTETLQGLNLSVNSGSQLSNYSIMINRR